MARMSTSILSLHVLDTTRGGPGAGMRVELHRVAPDPRALADIVTNEDGRAPVPLLPPDTFLPGTYELRYHIAAYFRARGIGDDPPFLDIVPVRFTMREDAGHYHVPLQVTPFAYATYRGS
jgi:5-hydroxyisourate hydrolase